MECGLERGQSVKFNTTLVVWPPNSVKKVKLWRDERRKRNNNQNEEARASHSYQNHFHVQKNCKLQ